MYTTKRLLLLTSYALCIALAQTARADFTGLQTVERTDLPICQDPSEPEIPYKLDVCNVYAVFNNPGDRLISVAFSAGSTTDPNGFYQHSMHFTDTAPACALVALEPTAECDSYVTIGVDCGPAPPDLDGTTLDPDWNTSLFNSGGQIAGGWYNSDPDNGQGTPDANGKVLVAQFSVKQNKNTSGTLTVYAQLAGTGEIVEYTLQAFDCSTAAPGGGGGTSGSSGGSGQEPEGGSPPIPSGPESQGAGGAGPHPVCVGAEGDAGKGCCGAPHPGGCDCLDCCEIVCAEDPTCCDYTWSQACADLAYELCDLEACYGEACAEATGSCFETHGTPGCDCQECCTEMCCADPFCCDPTPGEGWKSPCRQAACQLCDIIACGNCDGVGLNNGEAIASGEAQDCNGNGLPDNCEMPDPNKPEDPCHRACFFECGECHGNCGPYPDCEPICDPDCNANEIPDECDVASGTSADCNCNGIPDECELPDENGNEIPDECEDCNANDVLDSVDISSGTSQDCNSNGIPDECDLAVRGPIMLSGDDADDGGHCPTAESCGRLYPALFEWALANSRVTPADSQKPIVAIGVNEETSQAGQALNAWLNDLTPRPGVEFVTDTTTPSIADVNFADFSVVYIPSVAFHTFGGITPAQLDMLNARQEDIKAFVNFLGGGLIALTEAFAESPGGERNAYGWLPFCLDDQDFDHFGACPTPELSLIPGHTASCGNMTRGPPQAPYHTIFTGPPDFSGLSVLALDNDPPVEEQDVMIVGQLDFVAEFDCNGDGVIDECQCPTDVDGDGNTGPFDLAVLLGCWGPLPGLPQCNCQLDADDDGMIGPFDLAFLLGNWGPCPP